MDKPEEKPKYLAIVTCLICRKVNVEPWAGPVCLNYICMNCRGKRRCFKRFCCCTCKIYK